jgi:hypothetical protein
MNEPRIRTWFEKSNQLKIELQLGLIEPVPNGSNKCKQTSIPNKMITRESGRRSSKAITLVGPLFTHQAKQRTVKIRNVYFGYSHNSQ